MQNLKAINLCILIPFIAFFSVNPLFFGWSGNKSNQFQHFYCFFILIPFTFADDLAINSLQIIVFIAFAKRANKNRPQWHAHWHVQASSTAFPLPRKCLITNSAAIIKAIAMGNAMKALGMRPAMIYATKLTAATVRE